MAITATYSYGSKTVKNATIKLTRIWGSKSEDWNAWVVVLQKPKDVEPLTTFSVRAPYVEGQNPYEALYAEVGKLSFLSGVEHDVIVEESKGQAKDRKGRLQV